MSETPGANKCHSFPDAREIVVAVREFLTDEVMPRTGDTTSFHARVAANLLTVLERELDAGAAGEAKLAAVLSEFDASDERELATRIRARHEAPSREVLMPRLAEITRERLLVSNPRHLDEDVDDDPRSAAIEDVGV